MIAAIKDTNCDRMPIPRPASPCPNRSVPEARVTQRVAGRRPGRRRSGRARPPAGRHRRAVLRPRADRGGNQASPRRAGDRRQAPHPGQTASARGKLAEELAPIDIPAALGLLIGVEEEREYGQYLGHIAHELAGRNPAEAERILMMSPDAWPNFRDNYTQRVCYRMAGVDLERAGSWPRG